MFHFKKNLKIFQIKKKNEEVKSELFSCLSYNSHFSYTKTSILAGLK